jgi:streptogramin lyase
VLDLLTQGIVCILNNDGSAAGTGFVVSESGLIATCSHVIQHWKYQGDGNPLPEKVRILFYATGDELDARVESDWWLPHNKGDLAVLRLDGRLPQGIQPLPLGSSQGTNGHPICTFGFPKLGISGIGGDGKVIRSLKVRDPKDKVRDPKDKDKEISLVQLSSHEITVGFSGAPVWNTLTRRVIGIVSDVTFPDYYARLGTTAFAVATEMLQGLCPSLRVSDICPYLGLDTFQETHAEFFFGRQAVVDRILNRLRQGSRFLTIIGASGSGKSSIIQAGLIPQLKKGMVPRSDFWEVIVLRPVNDSLIDLIHQTSASENNTLQEQVGTWLRMHPELERYVIIVDQFEEIFMPDAEARRQSFLDQITQVLQSSLPVSVILVMRDDFYSRMLQYETLVPWIEQGQGPLHIPQTLKQDELAVIIQKPAEVVGLRFDEGLVELIVKDVMEVPLETGDDGQAGRSAILPLLESALYELWKRRKDGMLTHDAYKIIGSVTGALPQWATQALSELQSDVYKGLVQRIFTDLVYLGNQDQGTPDIKRRRTLDALCRQNTELHDVEHIIHHLELPHHRLLISGHDIQTGKETVELIHDILIYRWESLKDWIRKDRAFLLWRQEIEQPLQVWKGKRDKNKLLRGYDLREAKKWLKDRPSDFSQDEVAFLRASVQRSINLLVRLSLVVFLFLTLTGAASWFYFHQTANPTQVTNLNDDGPGSLRYCVNNLQSYPTLTNTITFAPGLKGTIHLTSGTLSIKGHMTINGPGANLLTVTSGKTNSNIAIQFGALVTISGLSFRDSSFDQRSFINNNGTLTLTNSTFTNNHTGSTGGGQNIITGSGGSIENNSGTLVIRNSTITNNSAFDPFFGGSGHQLTSGGLGGGIYNYHGILTVINSTIAKNSSDVGGGIENDTGTVMIRNSAITGNSASGLGGGIDTSGKLTVINSTLAYNAVGSQDGQYTTGGAINSTYAATGPEPLSFVFDTIYGNTSSGVGGAIENTGDYLTIENSIIAGNHTQKGSDIAGQATSIGPGTGALVTTGGYNLFQNIDGVSFNDPRRLQYTDKVVDTVDSIFAPHAQLQDNGGPTQTIALFPSLNNPAIGIIPLQYCHISEIQDKQSSQYTDQRGMLRPDGTKPFCDIGAYEIPEKAIVSSLQPDATTIPTPTPTLIATPFSQSQNFVEFPIPTPDSGPEDITLGPDGNLWFTEFNLATNNIGRVTPDGTITEFPLPTSNSIPFGITTGADGNLWFCTSLPNQIDRITPNGVITEFQTTATPAGLVKGSDGNLWFTEASNNKIGRITPNGVITEFNAPSSATGLVLGSDGNLWFLEPTVNNIGRITPTGKITEFAIPTPNSGIAKLVLMPDGNLWFLEASAHKLGRITPNGTITEFNLSRPEGEQNVLFSMIPGPDGNLWFTETGQSVNKLARITLTGTVTEFPIPSGSSLGAIILGPDGNLWFTLEDRIGRITSNDTIAEFALPARSGVTNITAGPDNTLWFIEYQSNHIGRITVTK